MPRVYRSPALSPLRLSCEQIVFNNGSISGSLHETVTWVKEAPDSPCATHHRRTAPR